MSSISLNVSGESALDQARHASLNVSTLDGLVSDEVREIFTLFNFVVMCGILVVFGSATNIINIIVFAKIGFGETVNISLMALAISDLGCCASLVMLSFCYNPMFRDMDLPFDPVDFHYLSSGWIFAAFMRITSCITAFITFERCLCVAAPLKVKEILTPKRVTIFLIAIYLSVIAVVSPIYYTARYVWKFSPEKNRTIIVLTFIENSEQVDNVTFAIHSIFLPITAFVVVLVSTIILVLNLRRKTKWRESASASSSNLSTRDAKVAQMVVMIATLFMVCFIPVSMSFTAMLVVPEFYLKGRYKNMFLVVTSFHFSVAATNSSLNIFIYYRMSSNYRAVFLKMFGLKPKEETSTKQLSTGQKQAEEIPAT